MPAISGHQNSLEGSIHQGTCLQDYALEENEGSMRKAAHLMVSSLAGSLALVTCREPLRSSLATQLRHLLTGTMDASQLDQTVNVSTVNMICPLSPM